MAIVRVKPEVACVVFDEATGGWVTLTANTPYDSKDAVAKKFAWAFETDDEAMARDSQPGRITSVNFDDWVEKATAVPGEKRSAKHAAPTADAAADLDVIAAPEANSPGAFADDETDDKPGPIKTRPKPQK